jgi:hypothetical protein
VLNQPLPQSVAALAGAGAAISFLFAYWLVSNGQFRLWVLLVIVSVCFLVARTVLGAFFLYAIAWALAFPLSLAIRRHTRAREDAQAEAEARLEDEFRREFMQNAREREEEAGRSPEERNRRELALLEVLDRLAGSIEAQSRSSAEVSPLARALGWTVGALEFVAERLKYRGLVKIQYVTWRYGYKRVGSIAITKEGFERLEKVKHPDKPAVSSNLLINSIINVGSGNQQAVNSPGALQQGEFEDAAVAELQSLLVEYRKALETESVPEDVRSLASADIAALQVQLTRSPLNRAVVRELLISLRTIAEGIAGSAVFAYLASRLGS